MPTTREATIINVADDFGISQVANNNILTLVKKGKVDRVSVLVGPQFPPLKSKEVNALLTSKVKLDLHLDYQGFLFPPKERKLKEGIVARTVNFALGYLTGKGSAKKVYQSWEAQIKEFNRVFGRMPDGLNSHQHIHFFPAYFKLTLQLAKKYYIPHLRYGSAGLIKSPTLLYHLFNGLRKVTLFSYRRHCGQSSDYLVSLDWIKNMNAFLSNLPPGTTEIVCHPEREEEFKVMLKHF